MPRHNASRSGLPRLPVVDALPALREALAEGHAVLTAEPGSGKTTLVPLHLLDEPWLQDRKILMLEPRRPAARMAARRMASLLGEAVGGTVGYQVRFDRQVSASTRIEVLTEGLLVRRLQGDPELAGVGLLIFDEFHERHLQGDLSLALALDAVAALRDDLRLLVMSASLAAQPLSELMPATVIDAGGRQYPVEVHHAEQDAVSDDPVPACLQLLDRALRQGDADVLVFLPGRREIERMNGLLAQRNDPQLRPFTLYGDMPAEAQDAVLQGHRPDGPRRVILATDIAETSLTIEGVAAVVDSGLARRPAFNPVSGLTRMQTVRISKASALQRAGRAGRLGPGHCYRAWTLARHERLDDWTAPEVMEADLASLVLEVAHWGLDDPAGLRWPDPPPAAHWQQAVELLQSLDALDARQRLTPVGRRMARIPAHPRLSHVLARTSGGADRQIAADVAALLSERDPLQRAPGNARGADIGERVSALGVLRAEGRVEPGFDRSGLQRVARVAEQYLRLCPAARDDGVASLTAAYCVALAFPDRVAIATPGDGQRYLMRNGRAARLRDGDPLYGSRYLAIAAVDAGRRDGVIWLAAAFDEQALETLFGDQIEAHREVRWDDAQHDLVARSVRRLGALLLSDRPVPLSVDDAVADRLVEQIRRDGLARFFDDPQTLRARVVLARRLDPQGDWPDFSDPGWRDGIDGWLRPWLDPGKGARQLRSLDLEAVLKGVLGWERMALLDRWLPTHFETPAGTRRAVHYPLDGQPPVLAAPLQEMLGLRETPRLADGRVELLLHLLSPAGRPLQVTADLAAFWRGAYDAVKKEMRGRYPKHYWPDDPATAKATRFTKRRM